MDSLIQFFTYIIVRIYQVLSFKPFPDLNITYANFLITIVIIIGLFKFLFGGFKEFENDSFSGIFKAFRSTHKEEHKKREKQIVEEEK